jgi:DHA1 family tetracycline resistance protein-like MFS transporter
MAENDTLAGPGRNALTFVLLTVGIDAMGFGIIIPVMPDLVREVSNTGYSGAALWGGYLSFSYAVMQFLFGPTIGNLSDRFGRRPILLVSLAVLAADFLIMAVAPSLLVLFIGRIMAGMAAATHSTAHAFVADISAKQDRARYFGLIGAAFGVGFILGPIIGGVAGEFGTRAPFYAATGLAFATADWMVYAWLPVIALGAVIGPALLALMSNLTPDNSQGELQGLKTSVVGITMIISPLMMTQLFGYFSGPEAPVYFPGAPFMAAAGLIALALIPFAIGHRRKGL